MITGTQSLVIGIAACAVSAALGAAAAWRYEGARHEAEMSSVLAASARALQTAQADALTRERAAREAADELEVQHAKSTRELAALHAENQQLVAQLRRAGNSGRADVSGGLRDRTCICSAGVSEDSGAARAAGGAACPDVSTGIAERLVDMAHRADVAALYARTCYDWVTPCSPRFPGGTSLRALPP